MAPGNNRLSTISSEIFKYVRIHPNFVSRPVLREKMFLCCFSLKAERKDLTNRHESLPPPPPSVPPNDVKRILAGFCCVAQGVHISCIQEGGAVGRERGVSSFLWERLLLP